MSKHPQFLPEHLAFRESVKNFVLKEILPHRMEWEKSRHVPKDIFSKMGEQGFLGITLPQAYGGSGCDYWYKVCFAEEMMAARMNGFVMDVMVHTDMTTPIIAKLGNEEQKQEILPRAIRGEVICALGVTEPNGGSDVAHLKTTARREGDFYIINGSKTYITNGNRADYILLAVRTGPAITKENFHKAHAGISFLLFPTHDEKGNLREGFSTGRKLDKLGNHSSDTAELSFQDCKVPARYLFGEENKGFYIIMNNFQGERLVAAVMSVAASVQMIDDALAYARERQAFGRPIIDYQIWKHRLAQLLTELEAGRALTYHAADLFNRNLPCVKEISMAKLYTTELVNKVANECLQIHGGAGYIEEYDIARAFRDVRLLTIGAGTSEIMREIIAKECQLY